MIFSRGNLIAVKPRVLNTNKSEIRHGMAILDTRNGLEAFEVLFDGTDNLSNIKAAMNVWVDGVNLTRGDTYKKIFKIGNLEFLLIPVEHIVMYGIQ